MRRENLYIHHDAVSNHIMTRGINFLNDDFPKGFFPNNLILGDSPEDTGRMDVQTNFKILRGSHEIIDYLETCERKNQRVSDWIDFRSFETMHQLTPAEIAELLYLFHSHRTMRSAFFYKLQNNFAYLSFPNGLNKVYYRQSSHFYPRLQRVLRERMTQLINERGIRRWTFRQVTSNEVPRYVVKKLSTAFNKGLKINFNQAYRSGTYWRVPMMSIQDDLALLDTDQSLTQSIGEIIYDLNSQQWTLDLLTDEKR